MSGDPLLDHLHNVVIGEVVPVRIEVADSDPAWAERFEQHAQRIRAALGATARSVEHIGSTAVPGLAAKPIVDILLVVNDPADEASYLPALEAAGYFVRVRERGFEEHRMLRTTSKDVHLHVFAARSREVDRHLALRDLLRSDAQARMRYEGCKRELAAREWPTLDHYAQAKSEVIDRLIAEAGGPPRLHY